MLFLPFWVDSSWFAVLTDFQKLLLPNNFGFWAGLGKTIGSKPPVPLKGEDYKLKYVDAEWRFGADK